MNNIDKGTQGQRTCTEKPDTRVTRELKKLWKQPAQLWKSLNLKLMHVLKTNARLWPINGAHTIRATRATLKIAPPMWQFVAPRSTINHERLQGLKRALLKNVYAVQKTACLASEGFCTFIYPKDYNRWITASTSSGVYKWYLGATFAMSTFKEVTCHSR